MITTRKRAGVVLAAAALAVGIKPAGASAQTYDYCPECPTCPPARCKEGCITINGQCKKCEMEKYYSYTNYDGKCVCRLPNSDPRCKTGRYGKFVPCG